jgi:hypothetical protein
VTRCPDYLGPARDRGWVKIARELRELEDWLDDQPQRSNER